MTLPDDWLADAEAFEGVALRLAQVVTPIPVVIPFRDGEDEVEKGAAILEWLVERGWRPLMADDGAAWVLPPIPPDAIQPHLN